MTKPPKAGPYSDIDGIHEDRRDPPEAANAAGQTAQHVKRAEEESKGRPRRTDHGKEGARSGDDRAS